LTTHKFYQKYRKLLYGQNLSITKVVSKFKTKK